MGQGESIETSKGGDYHTRLTLGAVGVYADGRSFRSKRSGIPQMSRSTKKDTLPRLVVCPWKAVVSVPSTK